MRVYFAPDTSDHPNWGCRVMGRWFPAALARAGAPAPWRLGSQWFYRRHRALSELDTLGDFHRYAGEVRAGRILPKLAAKLQASRLVTGVSAKMDSEELARRIGKAWERLPEPRHAFSLEIITPGRPSAFKNLGPHPPRLWPEDVDLVHEMWLEISDQYAGSKVHHRDIVGVALRRMRQDLKSNDRGEVVQDILDELSHHKDTAKSADMESTE